MGKQCEEAVAQYTGDRHGNAQIFGRRKGEADILLAEWCREASRFELLAGDHIIEAAKFSLH